MLIPPMQYNKAATDLVSHFEGCKLKAYFDAGNVPTIGWGHTRGVAWGLTCIQEQADTWRAEDMGYAEAVCNSVLEVRPTQDEFDAFLDFEFNTGGLKGSTMLRLWNESLPAQAANEFEKWDHVKAKVVAGLLQRRQAELDLFNR